MKKLKLKYAFTKEQSEVWFYHSCFPESSYLKIVADISFNENIDLEHWLFCVEKVISRYDIFKYGLHEDGYLCKLFDRLENKNIETYYFNDQEPNDKFMIWQNNIVLDLFSFKEPLFHIYVYSCGSSAGMIFAIHRIIGDEQFCEEVVNQIAQYYRYKSEITDRSLIANRLQYEYTYIGSQKQNDDKEFWRNYLKNLSLDNSYIPKIYKSFRKVLSISKDMTVSIRQFCKTNRINEFTYFLALYLLERHITTNENDIVLGIFLNVKNAEKIANLLPLRGQIYGNMLVIDLIKKIESDIESFIQRIDFSFKDIAASVQSSYGYTYEFINSLISFTVLSNNELINISYFPPQQQHYPLQIQICSNIDNYSIAFDFADEVYNEQDTKYLLDRYYRLAEIIMDDYTQKISQICLLKADDINGFMNDYNDTHKAFVNCDTVLDMWNARVKQTPLKIAASLGDVSMSCQELDIKSNIVATSLLKRGVEKNQLIGVSMAHSLEMLAVLLGIMKAGCVFIPIDVNYPINRINYIIRDTALELIVTDEHGIRRMQEQICIELICVYDMLIASENGVLNEQMNIKIAKHDPAYIIYTSGSTGNPKGVIVEHCGLMNYICWGMEAYSLNATDVVPLYSSIAFDLTLTSIYIPLVCGAEIAIYPEKPGINIFENMLAENRITFIKLTPTHLYMLNDLLYPGIRLKKFVLGGEQLLTSIAKLIHDTLGGDVKIYNEYGPTETVVGCMIHQYDPSVDTGYAVPIGKPINNINIMLLDQYGNILPEGVTGEIYIVGEGVARGYLNHPELTWQRFIPSPFHDNKYMYRSGDIAEFIANDKLMYVGRRDGQVKIRGHRIEIGEIENALDQMDEIAKSLVNTYTDYNGNAHLCAYYIAQQPLVDNKLRTYLARELPSYMIPSIFIWLKEFPSNNNGKIEIKSLPNPLQTKTSAKLMLDKHIAQILIDIISKTLKIETTLEDNFFSVGGDSFDAITICQRLNGSGYFIKPQYIFEYPVLKDLLVFMQSRLTSFNSDSKQSHIDLFNFT